MAVLWWDIKATGNPLRNASMRTRVVTALIVTGVISSRFWQESICQHTIIIGTLAAICLVVANAIQAIRGLSLKSAVRRAADLGLL